MSQRGLFSLSEEAVAEILRQLEEDIDFDTEVEWNENKNQSKQGSKYCRRTYGQHNTRKFNQQYNSKRWRQIR